MKILTVCGMGSGSSLILKMNIDSILSKLGVDADVSAIDLGSVKGEIADLIISTTELKPKLEELSADQIYLDNILDSAIIEEKLKTYFSEKNMI